MEDIIAKEIDDLAKGLFGDVEVLLSEADGDFCIYVISNDETMPDPILAVRHRNPDVLGFAKRILQGYTAPEAQA